MQSSSRSGSAFCLLHTIIQAYVNNEYDAILNAIVRIPMNHTIKAQTTQSPHQWQCNSMKTQHVLHNAFIIVTVATYQCKPLQHQPLW